MLFYCDEKKKEVPPGEPLSRIVIYSALRSLRSPRFILLFLSLRSIVPIASDGFIRVYSFFNHPAPL